MKTMLFVIATLLLISSNVRAQSTNVKSEREYYSDSQKVCADKWTKRGVLDAEMYAYCMGLEVDSIHKLEYLNRQYSDKVFYSDISFPYCYNGWTTRGISDATMIAYCLDQEIEGIKDVEYYRGKYGKDKVNTIVQGALQRHKSWNMAAYEVKNAFE
jgi:hypothetical protein